MDGQTVEQDQSGKLNNNFQPDSHPVTSETHIETAHQRIDPAHLREVLGFTETINLEQYRDQDAKKRKQFGDEFIKKHQKPRSDTEETRQQERQKQADRWNIFRKEFPLNLKIQRAKTLASLRLAGVRDAEALLRYFEISDISEKYRYQSIKLNEKGRVNWGENLYSNRDNYLKKEFIKDASNLYQTIADKDKIRIFKSIGNSALALERFSSFGEKISLVEMHPNCPDQISQLTSLAKIPEDKYKLVREQLDQYPFLLPSSVSDRNGQTMKMSRAILGTAMLEKGGFTEQEQVVIDKASRIQQLIGSFPHNYFGVKPEEIVNHSQEIDDLLTFTEAGGQLINIDGLNHYDLQKILGLGLALQSSGCLGKMVNLIKNGWQLSPYSYSSIRYDNDYQNWVAEKIDLATVFNTKLSDPDNLQFLILNQNLINSPKNNPTLLIEKASNYLAITTDRYREIIGNLTDILEKVSDNPEERLQIMRQATTFLENGQIHLNINGLTDLINKIKISEKFPPDEQEYWSKWAEIFKNRAYEHNDFLYEFALRNRISRDKIFKDGRLSSWVYDHIILKEEDYKQELIAPDGTVVKNPNAVANRVYYLLLDPQYCPENLKPLADFISKHEYQVSITGILRKNIRKWPSFMENGIPKAPFLEELVKNGFNNITVDLLKKHTVVATLSEDEQHFWLKWQNLGNLLQQVSGDNLDEWKNFLTGKSPATEILKAAAKSDNHQDFPHNRIALRSALKIPGCLESLSPEERTFWSAWQNAPRNIQNIYLGQIDNLTFNEADVKKLQISSEINDVITKSKSKELQHVANQIVELLIEDENPLDKFKQILVVFERNRMPEVGKIYRIFEILYPPAKLDGLFATNSNKLSPILGHAKTRGAYDSRYAIIYRDLLKVTIDSANPSLYSYLKVLQQGQGVLEKYQQSGLSGMNEIEIKQVNQFIGQMETLYHNSLYGRGRDPLEETSDLQTRMDNLYRQIGVRSNQTLLDRFTEMFARPLRYQSIDQVITEMERVKGKADQRNRGLLSSVLATAEQRFPIKAGDLMKGVGEGYLDIILQNGSVAKEYLGASAGSDSTPLDTDTSKVLEADLSEGLKSALENSLSKNYGRLIFVVRDRGQFQQTDNEHPPKYDQSKYEIFHSNVHAGNRDYGVRTGFPSTEIDYMIVWGQLADPNNQHQLERVYYDIAQNGFYIPVVDSEGKILFTPKLYEQYKMQNEKLKELIQTDQPDAPEIINTLKFSPYLKRLFESGTGVWEGYTLEDHTIKVMTQYERYFADNWSSALASKELMRTLLAIHDLGKPLAVQATGSTAEQHEYTKRFLPKILEGLGFTGREQDIGITLVNQDWIGNYIKGSATAEDTALEINQVSEDLGIPSGEMIKLLLCYYMCDAGSYTLDAGGNQSLDNLFSFQRSPKTNKGQIFFTPETQSKVNQLLSLITA